MRLSPVSTRTRFETVEGPISDQLLQHICALYGKNVDSRYADMEFTRRVFNGNPAGRSYHVFAYDGEVAIGCVAVIPVRATVRGHLLWVGKLESLYVRDEYRTDAIAGPLLVRRAYSFAASQGLKLQFALTGTRVERMLRAIGFVAIPAVLDHRFRLLRPADIRQIANSGMRFLLARGLRAAQAVVGSAVQQFVRKSQAAIYVNRVEDLETVLMSVAAKDLFPNNQWSVAMDPETLRWRSRIGCLDVMALAHSPDEFVAVSRGAYGRDAEILAWNVGDGFERSLQMLQAVIDKARMEGAAAISFSPYVDVSPKRRLRRAATLLGFCPWHAARTLCIRAKERFFLDPRNLYFNQLFSI